MPTKKIAITGTILGVLFIGYYFLSKYTSFYIPCLFHWLTGYYCPGCGVTRMFFAILKLNFYQAFRFNPLVFILLCLFIMYMLIKVIFKINYVIPKRVYYVLIGIIILFGILRNIPLFSFLKPTIIS